MVKSPRDIIAAVSVTDRDCPDATLGCLADDVLSALYDAGYVVVLTSDTRQAAFDAVNNWIKHGPLPEPQNTQRNGMVMAANLILIPQYELTMDPSLAKQASTI